MMITLAIFVLLAAALFGLMTGVLQSTAVLQDNQFRGDQTAALAAYIKNKLTSLRRAAPSSPTCAARARA